MGRNIHLSDKAVVTHVMVVVRDGDSGGTVPMPIAEFAKLFEPMRVRFKKDGAWGERTELRAVEPRHGKDGGNG